jgi:Probable sensor domain DACNV
MTTRPEQQYSRAYNTVRNTFHVNPHVAERLYDRYISALSQIHNEPNEHSSPYLASPVTSLHLQSLIEVSFWASLIREEGKYHEFSLALCPQEFTTDSFVFESRVPLEAEQLAKLAPAFGPRENSIGVWFDERSELFIWGFTPSAGISLAVRAFEPGQLLVSFDFGVAGFNAFISGSRTEFVDPSNLPSNLRRPELEGRGEDHAEIAKFMRSLKCGGTLLLVNKESSWTDSIHQPVTFIGPPYEKIKNDILYRDKILKQELNKDPLTSHQHRSAWEDANKSLEVIGNLTAADGATVITFDLDVLAFGAKIRAKNVDHKPERLVISEPFEGSVEREIGLSELGGTRHQSAAQFVFDQKEAIAIVASQDGRLSVLGWDRTQGKVAVIRPAEFALL